MTAHWDFVGRADELKALEEALWSRADTGAPLLVVHGEPGIGKTRVLRELVARVNRAGGRALWGSCYQGAMRPYGPWVEAISELINGLDPVAARELLGPDTAVLAEIAPDLRPMLPDATAALPLPGAEGRLRLYDAVVRVLEGLTPAPLVVLDDLQWADPGTRELLLHVARSARATPIAAAHRGARLVLTDPLAVVLAEAHRHRSAEEIVLRGLEIDDARRLLDSVSAEPLEQTDAEAIYAQSGGNPFFMIEFGRHGHGEPSQPPQSIRSALGLRLARHSPDTRLMLEHAAIFASGFGFAELQGLTQHDEETLLRCLAEALADELIVPLGGERYDFIHAIVRHTLYDELGPSDRARLHRRLAGVLEELYPDPPTAVALELVRQYRSSASLAGSERGVDHALRAAERARAEHAPQAAAGALRAALELVPRGDLAMRGRILAELALAHVEAGLDDEGVRTLESAVHDLEVSGAPPREIASAVDAVGAVLPVGMAAAFAPLSERALTALGEDRGIEWGRLKLLERRLIPVASGPVRYARFLTVDPEAVRVVRRHGGEIDYARSLTYQNARSDEELEELIATVESWRSPVARLLGLYVVAGSLAITTLQLSYSTRDRLSLELLGLAEELGAPPMRSMALTFRASILGARGEFDRASSTIGAALHLAEQRPPTDWLPSLPMLTRDLTAQHVDPDWMQIASGMWALASDPGRVCWMGLAHAALAAQAYARSDRARTARAIVGYLLPALPNAGLWDQGANTAVNLAGEAIWILRARDLAAELLPSAQRLVDGGIGDVYMCCHRLTVARLQVVLGDFDDAWPNFDEARQSLERHGQRPLRAIVDHDEAVARTAAGARGSAWLLMAAKRQFEELGMRVWLERTGQTERTADVLPDGLTPRQAEVLRLIAAGRSNKQIATELNVSVHTVERHLANAYAKIGAHNRADAAAYVVRARI